MHKRFHDRHYFRFRAFWSSQFEQFSLIIDSIHTVLQGVVFVNRKQNERVSQIAETPTLLEFRNERRKWLFPGGGAFKVFLGVGGVVGGGQSSPTPRYLLSSVCQVVRYRALTPTRRASNVRDVPF